MSRGAVEASSMATAATVTFSNISRWVLKSRTLWCSSGDFARSFSPGAPLMTMTGDFSAYAPATLFSAFRPPTQYVMHNTPRPFTRA